jgi:hypothetical protein
VDAQIAGSRRSAWGNTNLRTRTLLLAGILAMASPGAAQIVGSLLPPDALSGLAKTKAQSFADYQGRCVLVEFFAYW